MANNSFQKKQMIGDAADRIFEKIEAELDSVDGLLLTLHVVKKGKIQHHFETVEFQNGDFPIAAKAVEDQGRSIAIQTSGNAKA